MAGLDWTAALVAMGITWLFQWLLQLLAPQLKLLDYPNGRKDHTHPTPTTGGLAMLAGVLLVSLSPLVDLDTSLVAFLSAATLLVVVGQLDDRFDLPWTIHILAQLLAALIMIYVGGVRVEQLGPVFGLGTMSLGWLSVPFTVFATLGIINAINMIDGADGLGGSLVLIALVMLAAAALYSGNTPVASRTLVLIGVVAVFLMFNMRFPWQPEAKVFMGNAGSAFLGFTIAWLAFHLTQNPGHPVNPVLALWFVAIPVMDTLVLMVRRLRNKRSPFLADHNHIHHLMLEAGFQPTQAAIALSLFTALCGLLVGQAMRLDVPHPILLTLFLLMCLGWYWLTARRMRAVRLFQLILAVPVLSWGRPHIRHNSVEAGE